ncbi:MAG: glutathione S-transferase family protein [Alphaproteobacteria bacterium]
MSGRPIVHGAAYSVYVRTVRLTLEEKGVPYDLVEVDVFAPGGPPPEHLARHPFGRIPAFSHGDFALYEAGAIMRYIDEAFPGPPLQPAEPRPRARMNQALSVLDGYAYRALVWDVFVERVRRPAQGHPADEGRIAAALRMAETCLSALEAIGEGGSWLSGPTLTLADLHAVPMIAYFAMAPEGGAMIGRHARIAAWWATMKARESVKRTRSPFE